MHNAFSELTVNIKNLNPKMNIWNLDKLEELQLEC